MAQTDVELDPPLTKEKARAYVDCYENLLELAAEHSKDVKGKSFEDLDPDDLNAAVAALTTSSSLQEFMSIIEDHGFENLHEWAQTNQRFLAAYYAVELEDGEDNLASEVEEGIAQIEANEQFSDEQKQEMIEMLKAGQGMMQKMQANAPESDKDAVRSVKNEFERLIEEHRNP